MTKEEFFVVEELFKLFHENREEMSSTSLLAYYNLYTLPIAPLILGLYCLDLCHMNRSRKP